MDGASDRQLRPRRKGIFSDTRSEPTKKKQRKRHAILEESRGVEHLSTSPKTGGSKDVILPSLESQRVVANAIRCKNLETEIKQLEEIQKMEEQLLLRKREILTKRLTMQQIILDAPNRQTDKVTFEKSTQTPGSGDLTYWFFGLVS